MSSGPGRNCETLDAHDGDLVYIARPDAAPARVRARRGGRLSATNVQEVSMKAHAVLVAAFAVPFLCALPAIAADGKADGTLTVAQTPVKLVHAYAQAQKGFFDPKKDDVLVILSDVSLSGT